MRAIVLDKYNKRPNVIEVEPVSLLPHDVRVRTGASGVCHSDISAIGGQYSLELPIILGHEGAGTVEEVGSDVTGFKRGDRVIASWRTSCTQCWQCVHGRQHLCEASAHFAALPRAAYAGTTMRAFNGLGTMAELMTVNDANLVRVETELPDEQLALIGCGITTGVGAALWTAKVEPGSTVAVFGCGGVGLAAVQGARIAGAAQIIAIDPIKTRRGAALDLGATHVIDSNAGNPVDQVRSLTSGRGVEYAFEAVGMVKIMQQAYDAAIRGGSVIYVGALDPAIGLTLPANSIHADGKRILGSSYGSSQVRRDMPRLIGLVESGQLQISSMVSQTLKLDEFSIAFDAIEAGQGIRSVLIP